MSEADPARMSSLAPLRHPIFRDVWIASLASNFGGLIQSVGASWMMTSIAGSADMVALVQASTTLPIMLLSLPAGAIADNLDQRVVMLWSQAFMLAVSTALACFAWIGWITPGLLLGFTFLIGIGTAFNGPAWQASVGEMVPRSELPGAVALNSMGFNIARSTGPAIGGIIVAAAGAATAFAVNAVSYLGLIFVLARWQPERPARLLPRERLGMAMEAGLRYVAMSPNIRVVLVRGALFGLAAAALPALMPLIARDLIAGGPLTYGLLLGAFGGGAVGGAFLSGRLRRKFSIETMTSWSALCFAAAMAAASQSGTLIVTMLALLIGGMGWVIALSTFNVSVQMAAPRWVVARSLALYQMATFGGMTFGAWIWGLVAEAHGVAIALLAAAGAMLACVVARIWFALQDTEDLNLAPLRTFTEPEISVAIEPRSGPVVVTIEYRITQTDVLEFLTVMSERRRIRRRDGARHWTLLRDLQDAELWIERYHTPTWLDYIRHNQRVTKADAQNSQRIRALHRGDAPPRVHRMIERQTGSLPGGRLPGPREMAEPLTDPTRSS
jgi:MFS family permease